MRVFLVGATGVLGRALVPMLRSRGDTIVALVRSMERARPIAGEGVELHEGDLLTEDPARLRELLVGCDAAAHLATALRPGSPGLNTTNTNAALRTEGTRRLLDAVVSAEVPRYIQQSITMAYVDGGDSWLDETAPFEDSAERRGTSQPVAEMEAIVRAVDPERIAWVILRGSSFVGRDTRQDDVISSLKDGTLRVPGDGSTWISLVHVEDYAAAVDAALHASISGSILNITDQPLRNGEYLDRLASIVGVPSPERDSMAPGVRSQRCTNTTALRELSWAPTRGIWPNQEVP